MKTRGVFYCAAFLLNACFAANGVPAGQHSGADYADLPVSFEANLGQADAAVEFLARGHNGDLFLTRHEARLTLQNGGKENDPRILVLKLSGANANPKLEGLNPLPGKANYLIGNDSGRWRTDVPTFARVKYHDVYPGVDLMYYGNQQKLEYDFVVQPGASPDGIILEFSGADKITLDASGDLLLQLAGDSVRQHKPVVYQEIGGARKMLSGNYVLHSAMLVGFEVADYDKTKPLIIDPVLAYSATFGGSGANQALAIALDAQNNVYITGNTTSSDFPVVNPVQTNFLGSQDVFVTKFDTNGVIVYSTYLGGGLPLANAFSSGHGITVDTNGDAFVTGYTGATNFPTKNPLQSTNHGNYDAFVAELSPDGKALIYSTYLGGKAFDAANAIALDGDGNAIITGFTQSTNFPTANAAQPAYGGTGDAFVAKLSADGSALVYSTYLGGSDSENNGVSLLVGLPSYVLAHFGGALAVDFADNAYVTGWTYSTNFPVANAFQPTNATGYYDLYGAAFVTKFDPSGNIVYSTYFGGYEGDFGRAIGVDVFGNVYIAGSDGGGFGGGLPITNAFQSSFGGGIHIGDGFIAALDSTGTNLIYCTYLGGSGDDQINGIAVRGDGAVAVTGFTDSPDFPLLGAVQPTGFQGFFKSSNGAGTWNLSNSGLPSGIIYAILVDASNPSIIYVLAANGFEPGIFKSTDSGAHWTLMSSGLGYVPAPTTVGAFGNVLVRDPLHPGTLYAGGYGAVYKTTNGAVSWVSASTGLPASISIQAVAVDPATPTTLYAGTTSKGVYKSTDGGTSWNVITNGLNNMDVHALLVDPLNSSNVYAGVDNLFAASLFKSTNGGASWALSSSGLATGPLVALAFNPANSSMIYAIVGDWQEAATLCLSTNAGVNWSQPLQGNDLNFSALAVVAPSAPAVTIARSGNNDNISWPVSFAGYVLQSTPSLNPTNWQNVSQSTATNNASYIVTVPMSGSQGFYRLLLTNNASSLPPTIYVGTDQAGGEGLLQSTDGGITWNYVGFAGDTINAVAANPANVATVYAGLAGGRDGFVSTLTTNGQLYASTYLGGSGLDQGNAVVLNVGDAYVAGSTSSLDFPSVPDPNLSVHPLETTPRPTQPPPLPTSFAQAILDALDCPDPHQVMNVKFHVNAPPTGKDANSVGIYASGSVITAGGSLPPGVERQRGNNNRNADLRGTPHSADIGTTFTIFYRCNDGGKCTWEIELNITVVP